MYSNYVYENWLVLFLVTCIADNFSSSLAIQYEESSKLTNGSFSTKKKKKRRLFTHKHKVIHNVANSLFLGILRPKDEKEVEII